ncbi:hypothetical protein J5N97_015596 [Dioscorea zingiberensis]|uniref:Cytochrome b561 domain-containing protein n=1 Tax=Dioscorea zingiberensis TaxID=325984 RepID=A0A9D5CI53_9LILI|nr:hypothetical protein J5N97_015596 [Dioscorea zingiberensis]
MVCYTNSTCQMKIDVETIPTLHRVIQEISLEICHLLLLSWNSVPWSTECCQCIIASLATLQMFALLLRPKKDHKCRLYWNAYHYLVGYTVIVLSIINMFKGFDILDPAKGWKNAYIAIINNLGGIALVLEAVTWVVVLKIRKGRGSSDEKSHHDHDANGVNNSNGNRQSPQDQGV